MHSRCDARQYLHTGIRNFGNKNPHILLRDGLTRNVTFSATYCLCVMLVQFTGSLHLMFCPVRRHVAIMLPTSDTSLDNRSNAGRVSLYSHDELNEPTGDDSASPDAVVSADAVDLVMSVTSFYLAALFCSLL